MIYLDNAATTKPLKEAIDYASRFYGEDFFNPSALYEGGLRCKKEIQTAKDVLLKASCGAHEVIFTSCGSESDNQAIFGCARRGTVITTQGEHSAVYKCFTELKNRGLNVKFVGLDAHGAVNADELIEACKDIAVTFVSVVHVNNETGAINDVNRLAKEIKAVNKRIIFHSDGVQAFGKIPFTLSEDIDLYSVSAHKINAVKGVGALFKKKSLSLPPLIHGGGQEGGLRSGTENVFGIKAFEYAANEKLSHIKEYYDRVAVLKNAFVNALDKSAFKIISGEACSPYILSLSAIGVKGEVVMHMLEGFGIIVGNGSACSSKNRFSRVIEACGYKNDDGIVRVSFSPYMTEEEVVFAAEKLNECTLKLMRIMKK